MSENIILKIDHIYDTYKYHEIISDIEFLHSRFSVISLDDLQKYPKEEGSAFLKELVEDGSTTASNQFIDMLLEDGSIEYMFSDKYPEFLEECKRYFEEKGELLFYSPVEIEKNFAEIVEKKLFDRFMSTPRVVYLIDTDLIAGCKIEYQKQSYDLSLRNKYYELVSKQIIGKS